LAQISTVVRGFILQRLLDSTSGFNYWINVVAPDYPTSTGPFQLAQGTNLFLGQLTYDQLLGTGDPLDYPLVIVYSLDASSPSLIPGTNITPAEYSGSVRTRMDWVAGFATEAPPNDPDATLDMIEDALWETFNSQMYLGLMPMGTTYNNELAEVRYPLAEGGPNWIQPIRYDINFRLITAGR
jgi:hypothetical protein